MLFFERNGIRMKNQVKNDNPMISIITPVYNVEKYINRCVESIVNQSYKNFELILIDDGSTDKSGIMCDEWKGKDDRIVVVHQNNKGAGAARNAGLELAKGNYIGFVDSDDWIERNMYESLIRAFDMYPEADMAECETNRTREVVISSKSFNSAGQMGLKNQKQMLETFFRINGGESNYGICTKLIKKKVVQNFRFVEGTISEDVMASYFFYTHSNSVVTIEQKLYNYFQNQEGVTRKRVSRGDLEYINTFRYICEDIDTRYPEMNEYAEINYARANFTILGKKKLCGYDKDDIQLVQEFDEMRKIVRKYFRKLLFWDMTFSRKILLIWVCI